MQKVGMADVSYDDSKNTMDIIIESMKKNDLMARITGCPDSLGAVQYRAEIVVDEHLPATVTVTEQPPSAFSPQIAVATTK